MEMNNYFHTLADNIRNICGRVTITAVMVVSLGEEIYAALTWSLINKNNSKNKT